MFCAIASVSFGRYGRYRKGHPCGVPLFCYDAGSSLQCTMSGSVRSLRADEPPAAFHCALVPSKVMFFKLLHLKNAPSPMLVTLVGMVILVKLLHPKNACSPIVVTPCRMVILVKLLHPKNALYPMVVTLCGMVILVKLVQPGMHGRQFLWYLF